MDKYKTAGFIKRYLAFTLDWYLSMLVFAVPFVYSAFLAFVAYVAEPFAWNPFSVFLPLALLIIAPIINFLYTWYFTHKFGGTVGKLLFGLRIVDENGAYVDKATAFWRMTAGYAASSSFFGLGYFWAFRKKEDLTWHDRFFGTKVLRVGKPVWGIIALILIHLLFAAFVIYFLTILLPLVSGLPPVEPGPVLGYK